LHRTRDWGGPRRFPQNQENIRRGKGGWIADWLKSDPKVRIADPKNGEKILWLGACENAKGGEEFWVTKRSGFETIGLKGEEKQGLVQKKGGWAASSTKKRRGKEKRKKGKIATYLTAQILGRRPSSTRRSVRLGKYRRWKSARRPLFRKIVSRGGEGEYENVGVRPNKKIQTLRN